MFRYLLALLLVTTYSHSFVSPLPTDLSYRSPFPIVHWLAALQTSCKNEFLKSQISSKMRECRVPVSPFNEEQFECMMFYDINRQLCDLASRGRLTFKHDLSGQIDERVDVTTLCSAVKSFNFTNISEYPAYKPNMDKIFANGLSCAKACGTKDILSQDSNFYCKYFYWGSEMLSDMVVTASPDIFVSSAQSVPALNPHRALGNVSVQLPVVNSNLESSAKGIPSTDANSPPEPAKAEVAVATDTKTDVPASSIDAAKPVVIVPSLSTSKQVSGLENIDGSVKNPTASEVKASGPEEQIAVDSNPNEVALDIPPAAEVPSAGKDVPKLEETLKSQSEDLKGSNVEKEKPQNVPDDYPGNDDLDSEEGLGDTQGGDDGDDTVLSDPDVTQPKVTQNKVKIDGSVSESDILPNTLPEDYSDADDQVFYPFFLTAVILVILVYVLYHNKSKVSKVFLGLVVEGRQPGRRRNSRGHAYRRLDTLEQAMSADCPAPPSKIIY